MVLYLLLFPLYRENSTKSSKDYILLIKHFVTIINCGSPQIVYHTNIFISKLSHAGNIWFDIKRILFK